MLPRSSESDFLHADVLYMLVAFDLAELLPAAAARSGAGILDVAVLYILVALAELLLVAPELAGPGHLRSCHAFHAGRPVPRGAAAHRRGAHWPGYLCFTRWPPCVSLSCCSPSRLGGAALLCAAVLYRWVALAEPLLAVAVLAGQGI